MTAHLLCGDSFLVSQALEGFRQQVGSSELLEANSHYLSGARLDLGQLRAVCDAVPFLAERRLVVVEGLIGLFDPRSGQRRTPAQDRRSAPRGQGKSSISAWEQLPKYIADALPPTTELVFLEGRLNKGNPLLRLLRSSIAGKEHRTPVGAELALWIRNRVDKKGARMAPGVISLLVQFVGDSLRTMDNELEKLALYAHGRQIEEQDVRLLVSQAREANIFGAVDALLEGKPSVALRLMHRLRSDGADLTTIIAMTARQLRLVTLARDLIDRGYRTGEIGKRLNLTSEFVVSKTVEQARKHSVGTLKGIYTRLMEADLSVKQGRMDQDTALEILAGEPATATRVQRDQWSRQNPVSGRRVR